VYNASNEVAVQAFLDDEIRFPEIASVVGETLDRVGASQVRDLEDVLDADRGARAIASEAAARMQVAREGTTR
jgi:1-deoxy-D-xylulose-5-phosphate reductoisomerase